MPSIDSAAIHVALARAGARLIAMRDTLNELDAAMGDGDCGVSMFKGGEALLQLGVPDEDVGRFLVRAAAAFNRVAPSTLGTVVSTGLLRAGKEASGKAALEVADLAAMLVAADAAIQERGRARPGDKTIVDALHPAAQAFAAAAAAGAGLSAAGEAMLAAARAGRDAAVPLLSKKGRGTWVGDRSIGRPDPGAVMFVAALEAVLAGGAGE